MEVKNLIVQHTGMTELRAPLQHAREAHTWQEVSGDSYINCTCNAQQELSLDGGVEDICRDIPVMLCKVSQGFCFVMLLIGLWSSFLLYYLLLVLLDMKQ